MTRNKITRGYCIQPMWSSDFLKKGCKEIALGSESYYLCLDAGINTACLSPVSQALLQEEAIFTLFIMDERRGSQMEKWTEEMEERVSGEGCTGGQMEKRDESRGCES